MNLIPQLGMSPNYHQLEEIQLQLTQESYPYGTNDMFEYSPSIQPTAKHSFHATPNNIPKKPPIQKYVVNEEIQCSLEINSLKGKQKENIRTDEFFDEFEDNYTIREDNGQYPLESPTKPLLKNDTDHFQYPSRKVSSNIQKLTSNCQIINKDKSNNQPQNVESPTLANISKPDSLLILKLPIEVKKRTAFKKNSLFSKSTNNKPNAQKSVGISKNPNKKVKKFNISNSNKMLRECNIINDGWFLQNKQFVPIHTYPQSVKINKQVTTTFNSKQNKLSKIGPQQSLSLKINQKYTKNKRANIFDSNYDIINNGKNNLDNNILEKYLINKRKRKFKQQLNGVKINIKQLKQFNHNLFSKNNQISDKPNLNENILRPNLFTGMHSLRSKSRC